MNTMPRASTCVPSGTCVAVTSKPAANAGSKIDTSIGAKFIAARSSDGLQQSRKRVVEEAEEILRFRIAADGEWQHHRHDLRAFGDPLRCAVALIRSANHHLDRLPLDRRQHFGQI